MATFDALGVATDSFGVVTDEAPDEIFPSATFSCTSSCGSSSNFGVGERDEDTTVHVPDPILLLEVSQR